MIKLRTMTTAFVINNDKILLMERSKKRKFAPGIWAGVGGHLESHEINTPRLACLREIYEETGISEDELSLTELKFIILRKSNVEIRIQYVYFASTDRWNVTQTEEGQLHWIHEKDIFDKELSYTTRKTLEYYLENRNKLSKIVVGVVDEVDNKPYMNWNFVEDWDSVSFT